MSKANGSNPIEFEFDISDFGGLSPRQVSILYKGIDLEACAPLVARMVTGCNQEIGPLNEPDTYLDNITLNQWNELIKQLASAIKNG